MNLALLSLLGLLVTAAAAPVNHRHSIAKRALPRLGGLNIAGCEFGMNVWGWAGTSYCPGTDQVSHFVSQGANAIRLPFAWQYMTNNDPASGSLDASYFAQFDALVQKTTSSGAYAILDMHNYGRWNSAVIGSDGPSASNYAALWSLLAKKYAYNDKVIFALMNEPHDMEICKFAVPVQAAVNAIRAAGAKSQTILLPGNFWNKATEWVSGANLPITSVTDPATGDHSLLVLDVHLYIDGDGSGTSHECVTNGLSTLQPLTAWLKANNRKAIVSEVGGAVTASCLNYLPQTIEHIADNADAYTGFTGWAAGSFNPYPGYELSLTPNSDGSDNDIWNKAFKPFLPGVNAVTPPKTSATPPKTSTSAVATTSKPVTTIVKPVTTAKPVTTTPAHVTSSSKPVITTPAPVSTSSVDPVTPVSSPVESSSSVPVPVELTSVPAPVETSSASAPVESTSIPAPVESSLVPVETPAPVESTSVPAVVTTATAPTTSPTAANLQTFTEGLAGILAPAVTKSGDKWTQSGQLYNFAIDALNQSCYVQMDKCQLAANRSGNIEPLTVANCNGSQIAACLAAAQASIAA